MKPQQADISHIQACRNAWRAHRQECMRCRNYDTSELCEQGQPLYDEYTAAISAHRDLESVEATLPNEGTPCATSQTLK